MSMQFPINATPFAKFSPLGRVPAISLTQDLPCDLDADVLLLGCGNARNILFTIFSAEDNGAYSIYDSNKVGFSRHLDITCCDIEPAVIGLTAFSVDS